MQRHGDVPNCLLVKKLGTIIDARHYPLKGQPCFKKILISNLRRYFVNVTDSRFFFRDENEKVLETSLE